MDKRKLALLLGNTLNYYQKIKNLNPIAFWKLNEQTGTVANDISINEYNGTYDGATLYIDPFLNTRAPYFDGTNDLVILPHATLTAKFNGQKGSLSVWARPYDATALADGTRRVIVRLYVDGSNIFTLQRELPNNQYSLNYTAGATTSQRYFDNTAITWSNYIVTWSKAADQVCVYVNNVLQGEVLTTLGTWAGNITAAYISAYTPNPTPARIWNGYISHCAIFDKVLSASERAVASNF